MQFRPNNKIGLVFLSLIPLCFSVQATGDTDRQTPLVRAVADCRTAVVNLRGRKTVRQDNARSSSEMKQVNGMGTGVIIDPRGYILTNYHVVQDVEQIQVTTSEREKLIGKIVAHDPDSDLALLKIEAGRSLPVIPIGTSSDLMLAETVAAVGNAYGYEHTVTVGIVSQLGRTVQVNDDQIYRNLIQTDAPINPGNSGGPLLNLDGKMIGINVAVRIGAQGIAFAIPANDALEIASKLMEQHTTNVGGLHHGMECVTVFENHRPALIVKNVEPESPADKAGVEKGARITTVNGKEAARSLDLYTGLLGNKSGQPFDLELEHHGHQESVSLQLTRKVEPAANLASWKLLGISVQQASSNEMKDRHPNYQQGLKITRVRKDSPADKEGIISGDILVAMHGWKTESMDNLEYILEQPDIRNRKNFMFYILREKEPFWGKLRIASQLR